MVCSTNIHSLCNHLFHVIIMKKAVKDAPTECQTPAWSPTSEFCTKVSLQLLSSPSVMQRSCCQWNPAVEVKGNFSAWDCCSSGVVGHKLIGKLVVWYLAVPVMVTPNCPPMHLSEYQRVQMLKRKHLLTNPNRTQQVPFLTICCVNEDKLHKCFECPGRVEKCYLWTSPFTICRYCLLALKVMVQLLWWAETWNSVCCWFQ